MEYWYRLCCEKSFSEGKIVSGVKKTQNLLKYCYGLCCEKSFQKEKIVSGANKTPNYDYSENKFCAVDRSRGKTSPAKFLADSDLIPDKTTKILFPGELLYLKQSDRQPEICRNHPNIFTVGVNGVGIRMIQYSSSSKNVRFQCKKPAGKLFCQRRICHDKSFAGSGKTHIVCEKLAAGRGKTEKTFSAGQMTFHAIWI